MSARLQGGWTVADTAKRHQHNKVSFKGTSSLDFQEEEEEGGGKKGINTTQTPTSRSNNSQNYAQNGQSQQGTQQSNKR